MRTHCKNGGDDGTRTRGLCRDSETALGFTGTYKLRRPPKSLQNVPNFESCGSGVDRDGFCFFLPAKEGKKLLVWLAHRHLRRFPFLYSLSHLACLVLYGLRCCGTGSPFAK